MATEIWVNTGSGNGLLPDSTKPLPEPMLTDHQSSDIHIRAISQEMPQLSITEIRLKIMYLKFQFVQGPMSLKQIYAILVMIIMIVIVL